MLSAWRADARQGRIILPRRNGYNQPSGWVVGRNAATRVQPPAWPYPRPLTFEDRSLTSRVTRDVLEVYVHVFSVRSRIAMLGDSIGLVVRMCCTNPFLPARTRPGSFKIEER